MEADVEINCLSLTGSKILRTQRPKNSRAHRSRRGETNSEDGRHELCLSTRIMQHPVTPPNSPLVMQMYSHKKARESVMKRVQEQTNRAKKKRLLYLKTTSGIELSTTPGDMRTKGASPRHSHYSDPTSNRSPRLLPYIDVNYNNLTGEIKSHTGSKNHGLRTKPLHRRMNQDPEALVENSDRKIKFGAITINTNTNNDDDSDDDYDDENDDDKSYDSIAIKSIFVNNCNSDIPPQTDTDTSWGHRNVLKKVSWSPLQESYKGYLYKNDGTIVLTRKYQPPSQSNSYTRTRAETNAKQKLNKMYRWGYMDQGRILNKRISSLSITGTHA